MVKLLRYSSIIIVISSLCFLTECFFDFKVPFTRRADGTTPDTVEVYDFSIDNNFVENHHPEETEHVGVNEITDNELEKNSVCGNGIVEEGEECETGDREGCTTVCGTEGMRNCNNCLWGECTPPEEICDGLDQNCDGFIDNGLWHLLMPVSRITEAGDGRSILPAVAWNGTNFSVVWQDRRTGKYEIFFSGIESDLIATVSEIQITSSGEESLCPSVADVGGRVVVGWIDKIDGPSRDVFGRIFLPDATPASLLTNISEARARNEKNVAVSWTASGSGGGAVWIAEGGIYFTSISESMDLLCNMQVKETAEAENISISTNGEIYTIFWDEKNGGVSNIKAAIVHGDCTFVINQIEVTSDSEKNQSLPSSEFGGGIFSVVWQDGEVGVGSKIVGTTFFEDGSEVSSQFVIASCAADCTEPSVTWNGSSFIVAAIDSSAGGGIIFLKRFNAEGEVSDDTIIVEQPGVLLSHPSISWDGFRVGVVSEGSSSEGTNIYFALIGCM